jgi:hypothetical protein
MRRLLGDAHIARDHRIKDGAEMAADIGRNLIAEIVALVIHGQHDPV